MLESPATTGDDGAVNIGEAAAAAGLPPKTLRYYDEVGLVVPARSASGYREYAERDVHRLRFLQRSRGLGFSLDECRSLLSLYDDDTRASEDVKSIVEARLRDIDRKLAELHSIRDVLARLARDCQGDARPDCPILDELAGDAAIPVRASRAGAFE